MATVDNSTQVVTSTESGTGWSVDVTNCNLDPDLTLKDFIVRLDGAIADNVDFAKSSVTVLTYNGVALGSPTEVVIIRDTPNDRVFCVTYGDRFQSATYEAEFNRVHKILNENEIGGANDVRVSIDDTTPGTLEDKVAAGSDVVLSVLNPGANEQLQISVGNPTSEPYVDINSIEAVPSATGTDAIAIGPSATAASGRSIGIGRNAAASNDALAIGENATANNQFAIALGTNTEANFQRTVALGYSARAFGNFSVAIGVDSDCRGDSNVVIGDGAITDNADFPTDNCVVIGNGAIIDPTPTTGADSSDSIAIGTSAIVADSLAGIAIGANSSTNANLAIAIGNAASATGASAIAIGENSQAVLTRGVAVGRAADATGDRSLSLGQNSFATASNSIAIGAAGAQGVESISIGEGSSTSNIASIAIGADALANQNGAVALGQDSNSTAVGAFAFGDNSTASAVAAVQIGTGTNANASTLQYLTQTLANAQGLFTSFTTPVNYTPADDDNITSHLQAIDTALAGGGSAYINEDITSAVDITVTPGVSNNRLFITPTANINLILLTAGATNETFFTFVNLDPGTFSINIKIDLVGNPTILTLSGGLNNVSTGYSGTDYRFWG